MTGIMKLFAASLLMLATCAMFSGCGETVTSEAEPGTKRIILLTNGDDPFWDAMRQGMLKAAEDFKLKNDNLVAELDKNDNTPKGQIDKLNQYANQTDIAADAVSVTDAKNVAIAAAMRELRKKGVIVLTIDSDVDREQFRDARFAYLGTDNVIAGQELGKAAKGLRPSGGVYATFVGLKSAANAEERIRGFGEAATGFTQADNLGDEMDLSVAEKNVRVALDNHPNINTLVGIWAYNAHAIVEVAKERGIREKTTIVVFDAAPKAIGHMKDGNIDAMMVQNPYEMGYLGTQLVQAIIKKDKATITKIFPEWTGEGDKFKTPDGDIHTTELRIVVPDEKSPLKQEMFLKSTKFFYFDKFQAWLDERNLRGS